MSYQHYPVSGGFDPRLQPGAMSPQPRPAAATAITSAALAALGTVWHGTGAITGLIGTAQGGLSWVGNLALLFDLVLVVLLSLGAALVFGRKSAGRALLITGSAIAVLLYLLAFVLGLNGIPHLVARGVLPGALVLLPAIPAIATVVLVLLPATSRWLNQPIPRFPHHQHGYQPQPDPRQGVRPLGW